MVGAESSLVLASLAVEQLVVVLPEGVLIGGALAGLGRPLRLRPQEDEVPVPQANFPGLDVRFINLASRASGESPAVGSLKVAEFDDGDGRVGIASEMARLGHQAVHHRRRVSGRNGRRCGG